MNILLLRKNFLDYEVYLFKLYIFDLENAKKQLEVWQPDDSQPYWMYKKGAALADIGFIKEAESVVRHSLDNVRKKINQKKDASKIELLSVESYAMMIARFIQYTSRKKSNESTSIAMQLQDRWNELKLFNCDPWHEKQMFDQSARTPKFKKKTITKNIGLIVAISSMSSIFM
jgi:hypothetical protein